MRKLWSEHEIIKLKSLYKDNTAEYIAKEINRTEIAVRKKLRKLGLYLENHIKSLPHGERINRIWKGIKVRCYNKNRKEYKNYGGRGIILCDEWLNNSESFYNWAIQNGYKEDLSIERKDNNGNYCPGNCYWATVIQQSHNKRTNIFVIAWNETKTIAEWSIDSRCNCKLSTLYYRIRIKINPELAINFSGNLQREKKCKS